jgi:hypothetical protein
MFKPGIPIVANGSALTSGVTVSFDRGANRTRQKTVAIVLTNREAAGGDLLEISFDNGGTFFAVPPQHTITFPVMTHRVTLRGVGAAADYSIMGIIA